MAAFRALSSDIGSPAANIAFLNHKTANLRLVVSALITLLKK